MCTYYWLHLHHIPPCTRQTETEPRYVYCPQATTDAKTKEQQACSNQTYDDSQGWFDFDNPCSSSPCLLSTKCSAGGCRLEQLSGRWKCCRCQRGGNGYTSCQQPMRSSPDTFCYHVCCAECGADPVARTSKEDQPVQAENESQQIGNQYATSRHSGMQANDPQDRRERG